MSDIFEQGSWAHPALAHTYGIPRDIFAELWDWFFATHIYDRWCREIVCWQLHCVGGPGSGKTTLAALIANHLKERFRAEGYPVISVFIKEDVIDFETEFLEDFLLTLRRRLTEWSAQRQDSADDCYREYDRARSEMVEGSRIHTRITLLRKALYRHLSGQPENFRGFLLIDGIDHCSPAPRLLLDKELHKLQKRGMSILTTSRIPVFEQITPKCDHPNHEGPEGLDLYLICRACEPKNPLEPPVLCYPCKEAGRACPNCGGKDDFYEKYDHVNVPLSIPKESMENFIAWSLEREHGDLGLGSSSPNPYLSPLGLAFRKDKNPNHVKSVAGDIGDLAGDHIGLAKARLDLVHEAQTVEDVVQRRNQLPANIVAMFNAGARAVEAQNSLKRDVGLKAIAAAGTKQWISIPQMQHLLLSSMTAAPTRSGEDMIRAAKGFLKAEPNDIDPALPYMLKPFHDSFGQYVKDRFSESIHAANVDLQQYDSPQEEDEAEEEEEEEPLFDQTPLLGERRVRFEPLAISEPTEITPHKLDRTTTTIQTIPEEPLQAYLARKGTVAWN